MYVRNAIPAIFYWAVVNAPYAARIVSLALRLLPALLAHPAIPIVVEHVLLSALLIAPLAQLRVFATLVNQDTTSIPLLAAQVADRIV